MKTVLILGANSDVAKEAMQLYVEKGYAVIAASRSLVTDRPVTDKTGN